jgi:hypothetical protein
VRQDEVFLDKVRSLIGTARMAEEEAESYAEMIRDKKLKEEARRLLEGD